MPTTDLIPPMSRETIAAFHRGREMAINECVLVVQNGEHSTRRELVSALRELIQNESRS